MIKRFRRRALVAAVGMLAVPLVVASPPAVAQVTSCPADWTHLRTVSNSWQGHSITVNLYCHSNWKVYASGVIASGNLSQGHCVEAFHNVDLYQHRAPDLISLCAGNTSKTFEFWMYRQDGQLVDFYDLDGPNIWRKQTAMCVTAQWDNRRVDDWTCSKGSWGGTQPADALPYYDWDNYDQMLNWTNDGCGGCMRVRWLAGDHWNFDLLSPGNDRILSAGVTWSSYYGVQGQGNRFTWEFQPDGNLVVYRRDANGAATPVWASNTAGNWGAKLRLQGDGNLVIWRQETNDCIWHSNTWGQGIVRWANGHNGGGFYGYRANGTSVGITNPLGC